jgi:hypothetical protein
LGEAEQLDWPKRLFQLDREARRVAERRVVRADQDGAEDTLRGHLDEFRDGAGFARLQRFAEVVPGAFFFELENATGASVEGTVGADDPLLAFEDAIADFNPHHILIALRSSEESGWQERGLIEEVGERFGLPLTVFRITS